jgi:branched-chain amino acid transport system permease protein
MIYQILLSGIVLGSIYSLFAVGMVILYRGTTVLNFSQGELFMLGPFVVFTLINMFHVNYFLAIIVSILAVSFLGLIVFKGAFQRLLNAPHLNQILVTVALVYVFQGGARILWGSEIRFLPPLFGYGAVQIGSVVITKQEICILVAVLIFTVLFSWILIRTRTGKIMQAGSQSLRGASLIGINIINFQMVIWFVSAGIAALAGILVGPLISVMPEMGSELLLKAFAAMTLGGFGSIPGALVGGLLMGIIENLTAFYISTSLREISAFTIIIVILLVKPTGILGVKMK